MCICIILFIEFPDLQLHIDPVIDSVYIIDSCNFRLYFFFCRDFFVSLSHPLFHPATLFLAIPLHMAHPAPPPAPPTAIPPTSPSHVVPSFSLDDEDPSESSSGLSSGPNDNYTPAEPHMANGFLSSASDWRQHPPHWRSVQSGPLLPRLWPWAIGLVSLYFSERW